MGIVIDIIIVALVILSTFLGYKKGLVKVAVHMFAWLIAIVVTLIFYKPVANLIIEKTNIDDNIRSAIIENWSKEEKQENTENIGEMIENYVDNVVTETQNNTVETIADAASTRGIEVIAMIAIFVVTRITLILLTLVADLIADLPILKQFNDLGGGLYGFLRGLLIAYVVLAILFLIMCINANGSITSVIESSILTKVLYENNIILNIIL